MGVKKPAQGGLVAGYSSRVEFTDYMLWKAGAIVAAAFVWGLYRGFTGRSEHSERPDSQAAQDQNSTIDVAGRWVD